MKSKYKFLYLVLASLLQLSMISFNNKTLSPFITVFCSIFIIYSWILFNKRDIFWESIKFMDIIYRLILIVIYFLIFNNNFLQSSYWIILDILIIVFIEAIKLLFGNENKGTILSRKKRKDTYASSRVRIVTSYDYKISFNNKTITKRLEPKEMSVGEEIVFKQFWRFIIIK